MERYKFFSAEEIRSFSKEFNTNKKLLQDFISKLTKLHPSVLNDKYFINELKSWRDQADKFESDSIKSIARNKKAKSVANACINLTSEYQKIKQIIGQDVEFFMGRDGFYLDKEPLSKTYYMPSVGIMIKERFDIYPSSQRMLIYDIKDYLVSKYPTDKYLILYSVDCSRYGDADPYRLLFSVSAIDKELCDDNTTIYAYCCHPYGYDEVECEKQAFILKP